MSGTVDEIQDRISGRKAKVLTASEFKSLADSGGRDAVKDVDVVTCGTMGVMSGTMAIMTIPVAGAGVFKRADRMILNGIPANVGPCPNESLGIVDCIVYGTSRRDMSYGGGHLFRDMVAGKKIEVEVESEGTTYRNSVTLSEIPFARMVTTRGAFKNYTCFVNGSDVTAKTIFSGPEGLRGNLAEASVSGCGELNPLQNDPDMRHIVPGSSVLLNGAPGIVIGTGTRSSAEKPNLSMAADMHSMDPRYMGGIRTSEGPECISSVAVAIPVTDDATIDDLSVRDMDAKLPLADVRDRKPVHTATYASVWSGGTSIAVNMDSCLHCSRCTADIGCPMDARPSSGIDGDLCISCGAGVGNCKGNVFAADLGSVDYGGMEVPIRIRQSSRAKAEELCSALKARVEGG
ncbi:MAG: methanogenesis marker 16 metalloprotein, partial [Candidatus Methanomethylophilaceae archaeon]